MVFIPDKPEKSGKRRAEHADALELETDYWMLTRKFVQRWCALHHLPLSVTTQERIVREILIHMPDWLEQFKNG